MGKFILQVPRNTQNVSAIVGADFLPLHIHQMDHVYGLTNRLLASTSDLVQEALQVAEGQGDANLFSRHFPAPDNRCVGGGGE